MSLLPALGLGTWNMGESVGRRSHEVAAIRAGLDAGLTLIDTAEMYGDGGAERVVGEAIAGRREGLQLVSKVLPSNAGFERLIAACARSRERLGVERIDLYLLHWPGSVPLAETVRAMHEVQARGWIGAWGVSNFDGSAMRALLTVDGAGDCALNQIYYSLSERGPEFDLLALHDRHGVSTMAYCPLDQGALVDHPALRPIARRHGATMAQVALAWLRTRGVSAIPKSADPDRVRENARSLQLALDDRDLAEIDQAFPSPTRATRLKIV